jgi:hypothetical protein
MQDLRANYPGPVQSRGRDVSLSLPFSSVLRRALLALLAALPGARPESNNRAASSPLVHPPFCLTDLRVARDGPHHHHQLICMYVAFTLGRRMLLVLPCVLAFSLSMHALSYIIPFVQPQPHTPFPSSCLPSHSTVATIGRSRRHRCLYPLSTFTISLALDRGTPDDAARYTGQGPSATSGPLSHGLLDNARHW